jgi:hypothetical protein
MAREIPEVVRAAAGLAATVLDEARKLPETLPGLPVRLIGLAMQHAMKVQQQYAGFVARGDELFTGLRGEDEPGLATFDEDLEPTTAPGFRDSAFDRAGDGAGEAATAYAVDDAPATEEILDELAIDEMVGDAPADAAVTEDADALESALLESEPAPAATLDAEPSADVATSVDVLTPDGDVATVDATVTDEGVATPEPAGGTAATATATATDESGTPVASAAPASAPIEGYDDFSIAQLRGRLRGYALSTVADLVDYEEANRAREPYLRMLRNRLEKLEEQAVESSPLAPRGA